MQATAAAALLVVGVVVGRTWSRSRGELRVWLATVSGFGLGLVAFYGLYFGAFWFLSRYFFPLSPFLALGWASVVLAAADRATVRWVAVGPALAMALCAVLAFGGLRTYLAGTNQGHFQVVQWVEDHVPDDRWVAATQTGTLGFFHDCTINLDGKVNPDALRARQQDGDVVRYLLESQAEFIVDWHGFSAWLPLLDGRFERRIVDAKRNLAVLERVR